MSSSTIIKLRQEEASKVYQNGHYSVNLNRPIKILKGDTISFKSCFLDTQSEGGQIIKILNDRIVKITGVRYLTNIKYDNLSDRDTGTAGGGYKKYEPTNALNPGGGSPDLRGTGDGLKYFQCTGTAIPVGSARWTSVTISAQGHKSFIKPTTFKFKYTDLNGTTRHVSFHRGIDLSAGTTFYTNTKHKDKGIVVLGESVELIKPVGKKLKEQGVYELKINYGTVPANNGDTYLEPLYQTFQTTISKGNYTPGVLSQIITDRISKINAGGEIGNTNDASGNINNLYPFKSAFVTTAKQSKNEALLAGKDIVFCCEDGEKVLGFDTTTMVANNQDHILGAVETVLNYDEDTSKVRFGMLHTPIYVGATAGQNDGSPGAEYVGATGKIAVQAGGFMITDLTDDSDDGDFWTSQLGFDGSIFGQFGEAENTITTTTNSVFTNIGLTVHPIVVQSTGEGLTTTGAFKGLDLPVQKSDNFLQPDPADSVATDVTDSLYGHKLFNGGFTNEGFYLIELDNITQDMVGSSIPNFTGGSNTDSSKIQAIVGNYYSNGNFLQAAADAGIPYVHNSETPLLLSTVSVRVLKPNMALPDINELGEKNTVFMEINPASSP